MPKDLGDFQTPPALVYAVLTSLMESGRVWPRVLEPTCGSGNFIAGLLSLPEPPDEIQGLELQERYVEQARHITSQATPDQVMIHQANIFTLRLGEALQWHEHGPLLIVGNPPWVTNAALGVVGSANLPHKSNLKHLSGVDAMTGSANFDIAEYIWLKLIRELISECPTIALLCKTSVARNVLQFAAATGLPISNAIIRKIDAKKWFAAAVDACLFVVDVGQSTPQYEAVVYPDLGSSTPIATIGIANGQLVPDIAAGQKLHVLGESPLVWRQGLKHDAASVVELTLDPSGKLYNKHGETVVVESPYLYPLLKSSDLGGKGVIPSKRMVIVPQEKIGDDTRRLEQTAPRLWSYLTAHQTVFAQRKSSIYQNQPPFAYFGLGSYSFASYKVAISGLYKVPRFRAVGPIEGRPVMCDDTCYFLPCHSSRQAAVAASLLNDPLCLDLINTLVFWDAKRPITKRVLQRIDLLALLRHAEPLALIQRIQQEYARLEGEQKCWDRQWSESLETILLEGTAHAAVLLQPSLLEIT